MKAGLLAFLIFWIPASLAQEHADPDGSIFSSDLIARSQTQAPQPIPLLSPQSESAQQTFVHSFQYRRRPQPQDSRDVARHNATGDNQPLEEKTEPKKAAD